MSNNLFDKTNPQATIKKLSLENDHLREELRKLHKELKKTNDSISDKEIKGIKKIIRSLQGQSHATAYLSSHKSVGTGDIETAKKLLTEVASKTIEVERVSIWLLSDDKKNITCIDLYEASQKKHSQGMVLFSNKYPEYFKALLKDSVIVAHNALSDKSTKEFSKDYLIPHKISSMLDAVIFDEKGFGGVVCFEHIGEKRQWQDDEVSFAKTIASLFMRTRAIHDRIKTEDFLRLKNDEYEAQNEEYLQLNEELKQSLDELSLANEKVRKNEQQITSILSIVEEMVWSQDYNSDTPNYMSPSAKKVMGREAWEFYNDPELWKKIIHPEDVDYVLNELNSINNRRYIELVYRIINADGSIKWVSDRTTITYSSKNKPIRLDGIVSDITDKKTAEEKSLEQEKKLKTILQTMPDLMFVIDKDGYYQEVFTHSPDDLIIPEEEVIGINAVDVFGEEEGNRHIKAFRKCLSAKKLQILEYQIKEKEKTLYFEARLSPFDHKNVLAIIRDITERKESETLLAQERDLLQYLMDNIPDPIYFKDIKYKYTRVNVSAAKIFGVKSPEDAYGKTAHDFYDKKYADQIKKEEEKIIKTGSPILGIIEQIGPPEKIRWMLSSKVPIKDIIGDIIGTVGISRNITQLKEAQDKLQLSEELYRSVTDNAFDGIYLRNANYFEYVNDRFCEILGYNKEELYNPGFCFKDLLSNDTKETVKTREQSIIKGQAQSNTYEGTVICKSGEEKQVEFSTTVLKKNDESFVLGVMRDITERKNNELLMQEVEVAKKSAEFKQNFLANMSHEIRTPLTGIMGMIEMIDKTKLDVKQKNYLNILKHSTDNLREIINQVLDFSKIEAGKVKLKAKAFDFKNLLSNAKNLFSNLCDKDIVFESYVDPLIPDYIKADENRLNQIINNLISNAVKFTNKGSISLNANLVEHNKKTNTVIVKIEISDTGVGIKPEKQERLFIPFSQIDEIDVRQHDGTGLGLTICRELVKLHGGEIGFESIYGQGSTFWFTFKSFATCLKSKSTRKSPVQMESKPRKILKVLCAEDKIINQKVIKLMLTSLGHDVTIVNNGQEAIESFKPNFYDIIIMDIQMPVMDGITATKKLKEKYKNLPPIVGLSANAFEGDREKYMKKGLDEYLTKPLKSNDFIELFNKLFNS